VKPQLHEIIKAGIIVIAALIVLSVSVMLVGGTKLFQKYDTYYVNVINAAGLEVGAQVRLGGVRVGKVLDIRPPDRPGELVTIVIGVKRGTPIYKGTTAMITQVGFVGDIYILLSLENTTGEMLKVGETIPSEKPVQFTRLLAKLDNISESLDSLIKNIDSIFNQKNIEGIERLVGNTNKAIVTSSTSFQAVAASLKEITEKTGFLLNEIEDVIKGNKEEFSGLIKQARSDLNKAENMIKAIEETAGSVDKTSKSVNRAVEIQSRNLDSFLNSMNRVSEDLQDVLLEIKQRPWSVLYREEEVKEE